MWKVCLFLPNFQHLFKLYSFLLNSICCLEFFQRALCSSCFLMHDMGSFFPLVVLRPTGKGKFTRKDCKFEARGQGPSNSARETHWGQSLSQSHVNFYVYSNGSPKIWQHLSIDCTFIKLPELKTGQFCGTTNQTETNEQYGHPQLDVGSAKRVINCGFLLVKSGRLVY